MERIAQKHVALNILPEHYPHVANALLGAIGDVLGDQFIQAVALGVLGAEHDDRTFLSLADFEEFGDRLLSVIGKPDQGFDRDRDGRIRVGARELIDFDVSLFLDELEDGVWRVDAARIGEAFVVAPGLLRQFEELVHDDDGVGREDFKEAGGVLVGLEKRGLGPDDLDRSQGPAGAERVGVDAVDRFDFVAEVIEADAPGTGGVLARAVIDAGGEIDVDDAAADGKVPGLLDGVGALVTGGGKPVGELARRVVKADAQRQRQAVQQRRIGNGLHHGLDRGDDHAGLVRSRLRDHLRRPGAIDQLVNHAQALGQKLNAHARLARQHLQRPKPLRRDRVPRPREKFQVRHCLVRVIQVRHQEQHRRIHTARDRPRQERDRRPLIPLHHDPALVRKHRRDLVDRGRLNQVRKPGMLGHGTGIVCRSGSRRADGDRNFQDRNQRGNRGKPALE